MTTNEQYDKVIEGCRNTFIKKTSDYGTSWRVYRIISVVDQIYIKAKRIRTIQEKGRQMTHGGDSCKECAGENIALAELTTDYARLPRDA